MTACLSLRSRLLVAALGSALALLLPWRAGAAEPESPLAQIERSLRGRPDEALRALAAVLPATQGAQRVEALLMRGSLQGNLPDAAAAEKTAQELEQLQGPQQQPLGSAAAGLLRAGQVLRDGPAGRADRMLTDALARLPADVPPRMRLRFVTTQASIKLSVGKLDDAVRLHQQGVRLADASAPLWRRAEQRAALAYALHLAKQSEQALAVNAEAHAQAVQADDALALSDVATTESIIVGDLGRWDDQLRAGRAAIAYARQAGAKRTEVLCIANLADVYLKRAEFDTALALAQEALPLAREVADHTSESVALVNAGLALIGLSRLDEGKRLVREALVIEERAGALPDMAATQQEFGEALERAGQLREAWAAYTEHRRLSDEVFRHEHQQAVLELQEGFEAERRQRDLAILHAETGIKEALVLGEDLRQRLWAAGVAAGVLLLALVGLLLRRVWRSNAQLKSTNALLAVASERDPLTGLSNRRHFHAEMQAETERNAANGGGFEGSLLLIDIDHFKLINDEHGHAAGDAVLVDLAQRLRAAMRDADLTVRWGGEEFLVVVRALPPEQVESLAQRLLLAIGSVPVHFGGARIAVTASIGFATFPLLPARQPMPWERAIDLVDTAMYLAKAHGRNRAYGVRAVHAAPDGSAAQSLESAWREGRAELAQLEGPAVARELP